MPTESHSNLSFMEFINLHDFTKTFFQPLVSNGPYATANASAHANSSSSLTATKQRRIQTSHKEQGQDQRVCVETNQPCYALQKVVPADHDSIDEKLSWLRSQIIGVDAEFDTPFGRRSLIYADHTASGRSLHHIENYIATQVLPFYGNSHTSDSHVGYCTTKMVHEAASYVKRCLGGGEKDAIIFCGSGSTAAIKRLQEVMGIAVPSILRERILSSNLLRDDERWVVFVGPYEHHSNILSWRESLAEVVEIGLDSNGLIDLDALRQKLAFYESQSRPLLGSFSACSNVTGICTDTTAIARLLHEFGGYVCFDFAASGPYAKIDMRSGYDAIFLSPHKFLGGPGTPGVLVMNQALYKLGSSAPSTSGGGTVDFANGISNKDTLYTKNIEEREDAGTPAIIQKIRTALAFWIKEYIGYDAIEAREQMYITRAMKRLLPNPNIWILGNTTVNRQAILSFNIYSTACDFQEIHDDKRSLGLNLWRENDSIRDKPLHGPFVAKLLNDLFGIQARGGCACAGPYGHDLLSIDEPRSLAYRSIIQMGYLGIKPGWTRVSFPYYMSEEEFEFILAAIEFVAIYGQRFLPLYHFNWRSGSWCFKRDANVVENKKNHIHSAKASSLASMIKALDIESESDEKQTNTYTNYLEAAKQIAKLLPKFPPQGRVPDEINIDVISFRL